jgi:Xaa-Pro aminopeptidase
MQTMHLTLPVGAFGWDNNPLEEQEFKERITALRAIMTARGWAGLVVFGDIPESGLLTYVSNFAPRLSPAFALIPLTGEPEILSLDGGRMVDAGKETTWMTKVSPAAADLAGPMQEWLDQFGANPSIGLAGFEIMPADIFADIAGLAGIQAGADASQALAGLARCKSPAELAIIRDNCAILSQAAAACMESHGNGASAAAATIAAERAGRMAGAQDVRCLYSVDGGNLFKPYQGADDGRGDPAFVYIALRGRGYWVDGFVTIGKPDTAHNAAANALENMLSAIGTGKAVGDLMNEAGGHPLLGGTLGNGIGVSLHEAPRLDGGDDVFGTGDVVSVKIGVGDASSGFGFASGLLHVGVGRNEVLWQS